MLIMFTLRLIPFDPTAEKLGLLFLSEELSLMFSSASFAAPRFLLLLPLVLGISLGPLTFAGQLSWSLLLCLDIEEHHKQQYLR